MTAKDKQAQKQLEVQVISLAETLEELASVNDGDNEELSDFLEDVHDVEIKIDRYCKYRSVKIALAIGGPGIWFDTATNEVRGNWGGLHFRHWVKDYVCDAVDDYFEDHYNVCR